MSESVNEQRNGMLPYKVCSHSQSDLRRTLASEGAFAEKLLPKRHEIHLAHHAKIPETKNNELNQLYCTIYYYVYVTFSYLVLHPWY
jgi:hypothetical protein